MPEVFVTPNLSQRTIVRRYMDLAKLLDLLHTRELYLRRADGFSDRLEGALFPTFRKSLNEAHKSGKVQYDAEHFYRRSRQGNYVGCWTIGAHDNMALWQLYGGTRTSVAVTTTLGRLIKTCLPWDRGVHIKKVKYVDHRKIDTFLIGRYADVLEYKNLAYSYESELRVIVPAQEEGWEHNPMGLRLPLNDVNSFVRSIVVAPEANPGFKAAVQDLCRKYDLQAPVRNSTLSTTPQ